jgi:hypothetical protein
MSQTATGPRTDAGKARSSQNAVKHGLCSERAVIAGEDPAEWDAFREEIVRSFAPATFLERELAERVALQMWRQRRAARYEAELVSAVYDDAGDGEGDEAKQTRLEQARLLMKALDKVVRYESHIARQLKEALQLLREAQANRQVAVPSRPEAPPQPSTPAGPQAGAASSFRKTDTAERALRRIEASLPPPGVSYADFDIVPKTPAAKT